MKITLKTLPQATAQEVFDQVAEHLLKQNEKSKVGASCVYKSNYGLKCAAGCLISDDEYKAYIESLEGDSWGKLAKNSIVPYNHYDLIGRLQLLHDNVDVESWKGRLVELAKELNLQFKFDEL